MSVKETTNRLTSAAAKLSNRYAPAIITIIILACLFYYYFSVIVKTNERELKERKFRSLHQVAANIKKKLETYQEKNATNFINLIKDVKKLNGDINPIEKEFGLKVKSDSAGNLTSTSLAHIYDPAQKQFQFFTGDTLYATVDMVTFLQPLLRRDIFTSYLIATNGTIILDELNITQSDLDEYISTTIQDDTLAKIQVVPSGNLIKTNIAGKNYRLFTVAFFVNGTTPFTVGGYLPDDDYEAERKYIPTYVMLWLVIGVVLVIVMIPLLRIFLMHRSEQLVTMSVSAAFAAVHLLASIIILTILNYFVYSHILQSSNDNKLKVLADDIDRILSQEIQAGIRVLDSASREVNIDTPLADVLMGENTANKVVAGGRPEPDKTYSSRKQFRSHFYHIVWTDSTGMQRLRWTRGTTIPAKVNISDRDYYKAVAENKLFYNQDRKGYFFTQVSSWVSSRNLSVISTPQQIFINKDSSGPRLIMVSGQGRLKSMFSPVIPLGFSFCVVDSKGDVLFHKDERRNLNENIVKECSQNYEIEYILKHRTPAYFDSKYSGSNHRFYCSPIVGTDYSLITFLDMQQTWAEGLDVLSASSILVLFNLGIVLLAILVIRAFSYSTAKSRTPSLAYTWLRPVRQLKKEYGSITSFYLISMAVQLSLMCLFPTIDNLSLLASTFIYTYLMLVATFHQFSMYKDPKKSIFLRPKRIFIGLIGFLAVCLIMYAKAYEAKVLWLIGTAFIYTMVYCIMTYRWQYITPVLRLVMEKTSTTWLKPGFRGSYTIFVWSLITATSIVPLLIFYVLCQDEQNKMTNKYAQWDFAKQLASINSKPLNTLTDSLELSYKSPFHFKFVADRITGYYASDIGNQVDEPFAGFYRTIKPSFFNYNLDLELINSQVDSNPEFSWREMKPNAHPALYFKQNLGKDSSDKTNKRKYDGWKLWSPQNNKVKSHLIHLVNVPNVLLLAALLFCLYAVLNVLIRKVFFEGTMEPSFSFGLDLITKADGNLFIYGPPGTHKINAAKKEILKQGSYVDLDFADLALKSPEILISETESAIELIPEKTGLILITNIAAYPDDPSITGQKLTVIEHFQRLKIRMIIISSRFFDSLKMFEYNTGTVNAVSYTARWQNIMQSFYNVYHRWSRGQDDSGRIEDDKAIDEFLKKSYMILGRTYPTYPLVADDASGFKSDEIQEHILKETTKIIDLIREECSHSAFLAELTGPMITYASRLASPPPKYHATSAEWPARRLISRHFIFVFEKVCDRVESLAANHYLSLWNAVTLEEQRTLYDIAVDELINPLNRKTAARLCEIGFVNPIDGIACYNIMNISFRNYILHHVANNEISIFKKEVAAKGFGSSIQLPLVIVAISAFAFIVITQREVFTNVISYLGAGFAGITGLVKIISSIPASKGEGKA
jgi:hypothetical protein